MSLSLSLSTCCNRLFFLSFPHDKLCFVLFQWTNELLCRRSETYSHAHSAIMCTCVWFCACMYRYVRRLTGRGLHMDLTDETLLGQLDGEPPCDLLQLVVLAENRHHQSHMSHNPKIQSGLHCQDLRTILPRALQHPLSWVTLKGISFDC